MISGYSQANNCIKFISYDIVQTNQSAVHENTDISTLSSYDYLHTKHDNIDYHVEICIDSDFMATKTTTYQKIENKFHGKGGNIKKVIISPDEIYTFDYSGKATEIGKLSSSEQTITGDNLIDYGFSSPYEFDQSHIDNLIAQGNTVFYDDEDNLHVINNSLNTELIYGTQNSNFEYIKYDINNNHKYSSEYLYKEYEGHYIPSTIIDRKLITLLKGDKMQIKTIKKYNSYSVTENGVNVLNYVADNPDKMVNTSGNNPNGDQEVSFLNRFDEYIKPILDISVHPNPASDKISIDIPIFYKPGYVSIEILDATGHSVYRISNMDMNSSFSMDISNFNKGLYYINSSNGEEMKSTKFVKL